jgi:hypothetical protein
MKNNEDKFLIQRLFLAFRTMHAYLEASSEIHDEEHRKFFRDAGNKLFESWNGYIKDRIGDDVIDSLKSYCEDDSDGK